MTRYTLALAVVAACSTSDADRTEADAGPNSTPPSAPDWDAAIPFCGGSVDCDPSAPGCETEVLGAENDCGLCPPFYRCPPGSVCSGAVRDSGSGSVAVEWCEP